MKPEDLPPALPPRGVDLALDKFDLSVPDGEAGSTSVQEEKQAAGAAGNAFWSCLAAAGVPRGWRPAQSKEQGDDSGLSEQDIRFYQALFNPHLSDRRDEGDHFAPPMRPEHRSQLELLMGVEGTAQEERRQYFCSKSFRVEDASPLFPSWVQLSRKLPQEPPREGLLCARPDYSGETLQRYVLRSANLRFEKDTENGTWYRIYRAGKLEVRTIQEYGGEESVGAVFSIGEPRPQRRRGGGASRLGAPGEREGIVK